VYRNDWRHASPCQTRQARAGRRGIIRSLGWLAAGARARAGCSEPKDEIASSQQLAHDED